MNKKENFIFRISIVVFMLFIYSTYLIEGLDFYRSVQAYSNDSFTFIKEVSVTVYENERVILPKTLQIRLSNGEVRKVRVYWERDSVDTSKAGIFVMEGNVPGYSAGVKLSANIEPLDNIIKKLIILPSERYDEKEARKIIDRIKRIYPKVLGKLSGKGVRIQLITTNITDLPEYAYLKGVVPRGWEDTGKTWDDVPGVSGNPIAVKIGFSDRGKGHGSINLELHETAHTIDGYILNMASKTKPFQDIWKNEVSSLFPGNEYFAGYSDEYFAETFAMFYLDRDSKYELSLKAPETFKFFENLEESLYIRL